MNAFGTFVGFGFVACALAASLAISRFYGGPLPKAQIFGIVFGGLVIVGWAMTDFVVAGQREVDPGAQKHLDAAAAHSADLKRRLDANVAAVEAAIAEPGTTGQPPTVERDRAWQERVAALASETGSLIRERDALLAEIFALEPVAPHHAQRDFPLILAVSLLVYSGMGPLLLFLAARRLRGESRNIAPPSPQVERLARSGKKIAAIKAFREETGADLFEAKRAVEQLYTRTVDAPRKAS